MLAEELEFHYPGKKPQPETSVILGSLRSSGLITGEHDRVLIGQANSLHELAFVWFLTVVTDCPFRFLILDPNWSLAIFHHANWSDRWFFPWKTRNVWTQPFHDAQPLNGPNRIAGKCMAERFLEFNYGIMAAHSTLEIPSCGQFNSCDVHKQEILRYFVELAQRDRFSDEFRAFGGPAFAVNVPRNVIEALHSEQSDTAWAERLFNTFLGLVVADQLGGARVESNCHLRAPFESTELDAAVFVQNTLLTVEVSAAKKQDSGTTHYPNKLVSALALHSLTLSAPERTVARLHVRVFDPDTPHRGASGAAIESLKALVRFGTVEVPLDRKLVSEKGYWRLAEVKEVYDTLTSNVGEQIRKLAGLD